MAFSIAVSCSTKIEAHHDWRLFSGLESVPGELLDPEAMSVKDQ
jgi:hypothetical protein